MSLHRQFYLVAALLLGTVWTVLAYAHEMRPRPRVELAVAEAPAPARPVRKSAAETFGLPKSHGAPSTRQDPPLGAEDPVGSDRMAADSRASALGSSAPRPHPALGSAGDSTGGGHPVPWYQIAPAGGPELRCPDCEEDGACARSRSTPKGWVFH